MSRANVARLIATTLVIIIVVFVTLDVDHPKWAEDLAFWQPESERDITIKYGPYLGPNMRILLAVDIPAGQSPLPVSMADVEAILTSRTKSLAGADPSVQTTDDGEILVTMLHAVDTGTITQTLLAEGMVEFVNIGQENPFLLSGTSIDTSLDPPPLPEPTPAPISPTLPSTGTVEMEPPQDVPPIYESVLTSGDLESIELRRGDPSGRGLAPYNIAYSLTDVGAVTLDSHMMSSPGEYLATTLDKQVVGFTQFDTQPTPYFADRGGAWMFSILDDTQAKVVRAVLGSGPLPVPLKLVSMEPAEPILGKETIRRAGIASIIGLAVALVLLPAHYRFPGLLAALSLLVFGFTCFALCKIIPLPIALPTIAGFGTALPLALRAHLTTLERLRDEVRSARSLKRAVGNAIEQAHLSIRHTHLALLLIAIVIIIVGSASTALAIAWLGIALAAGVLASAFAGLVVAPLLLNLAAYVPQHWLDQRRWLIGP
jgi:protein-export membrane protein SecD